MQTDERKVVALLFEHISIANFAKISSELKKWQRGFWDLLILIVFFFNFF